MNDSILNSIKKLLGIDACYEHFDQDIIIHINTVFMTLHQLGAGPVFYIEDDTAIWSDYIKDGSNLEAIKTYIYIKVRLVFDPPSSSSVASALDATAKELEWRINVQVDPGEEVKDI